jgi:uncharacterized protein YprB with RNaseH-like and TPR domain
MPRELKARLRRIQDMRETAKPAPAKREKVPGSVDPGAFFSAEGWEPAGFQTVRRGAAADIPLPFPKRFPAALSILIPDFAGTPPAPEELLFFDLETTGLSGGAGTVAFLAAFGRLFPAAGGFSLRITQYLLLDYPGENDFLEALLGEFDDPRLWVVSYNGKTFDSQILKTRCLMNGIPPPEYRHADLLHPARRLWKRTLGECSQAAVEQGVLGIDRSGDMPGAMAPEIWFSFLKDGAAGPLLEICEHNRRDIAGLASMLRAMTVIAQDPRSALTALRFDIEQLALRWRTVLRRREESPVDRIELGLVDLRKTGAELLSLAVRRGLPKAILARAVDLFRDGRTAEGRRHLRRAAAGDFPPEIRVSALRLLAIDSERRLGNAEQALELAREGLRLLPESHRRREEFEARIKRLRRKTGE